MPHDRSLKIQMTSSLVRCRFLTSENSLLLRHRGQYNKFYLIDLQTAGGQWTFDCECAYYSITQIAPILAIAAPPRISLNMVRLFRKTVGGSPLNMAKYLVTSQTKTSVSSSTPDPLLFFFFCCSK